ncbi:SpaH/EbpB family LPXTG-anchored major pilin [Actinomyces sp. oral taxon 170]|uniref:SpaH/EbpB family LPXTG-anchored major pilin n=1 Tax=Actinomyces sp. oral taxon 170 TaxID=712117 RepID=UPI000205E2CE|nr:SpaH/EbpB family LPXTG-anchored major pilin [Actinomyces sp. oral taxon 170]EGF54582.1 fimbrial subunit type 1 [Actinomyces sp. oral taxon 170 str. F0386]
MHSLTTRRGLGLAAAMTLAAGALVAPTGAAAPADPNGSTIDPDAATTLTIHKCEQTDANGVKEGTGNPDPQVECKPVAGVEFTITKLNVDLTTPEGWKQLADAKGDVVKAGALKSNTTQTITTGGDGLASFTDAQTEVGAYLVSETRTPDKVIPAEDFVVTLPMTNPDNTTKWNYDVHVYPKNTISGVDKKVTDKPAPGSGHDITYTITTSIPKVDYPGGARIKRYEVVDQLDKRIKKDALTPVVKIVGQNETSLEDTTDYTLITAEGADHNWATIQLTEEGRRKAAEARHNGTGETKVQVTLTAKFDATVNLEGDLSNTAGLIPNDSPNFAWDPSNPGTKVPGIPTTPVLSKYGKVVVTKTGTDELADKTKYNGAQFQVYECTKTAGGATLRDGDPSTQAVDPLTIGGEKTFTTAGQGMVEINYLRANDYVDGVKKDTLTDEDHYCLVETKAPEGYTLQADPIPFRVLADNATAKAPTAVTVTDVPKNAGFRLPLTGANGVIFLTVAGALLVAGGAVVAYANKRRHAAKH